MWKNKHVVVAMLVAPVLAIIAYFATDYFVAEKPHAARTGASYPLVVKSNCRYESGECELVNGDVRLLLTADREAGSTRLRLASPLTLRDAKVAVATPSDGDPRPVALVADDDTARSWSMNLDPAIGAEASLRLVVTAGESRYFAEVPTVFFDYEPFGTR